MKPAVIVFPGSNCDRDAAVSLRSTFRRDAVMVWHAEAQLPKGIDLIVLPGGFSYGDYLRSGAMAAHSPIMQEIKRFAQAGGRVLGICNGFQVLTESGLLPGTLLRNAGLKFICRDVNLKVENAGTPFTRNYSKGQVINVPVAHHDGNYFASEDTLKALEDNEQIAFRYCSEKGEVNEQNNPNGSLQNIAGVFNKEKNVLGMMPHPERHAEALLGGEDGAAMFTALTAA